jgi:uncharacterized protein (TIGR02147 family)
MKAEESVRTILATEFFNLQSKNPSFSMRAYSKKVGIPQSAISEIIARKRRITEKMAAKILSGLTISPDRASEILHFYKTNQPVQDAFESLDVDQFHLISDWYYFAILSLSETRGFKSAPDWIAKRLGISEKKVVAAVDRLVRLGLLRQNPKNKKLVPTGAGYKIDPGVATSAVKKACRENIYLSSQALETTRFEDRDFTAITLCFDPAKMILAKKMIKDFRANFARAMEAEAKAEVYKLTVQLFPLTKIGISQ